MARAYRKKPVVVEAVQWTGENHAEMCEFIDPEAFEIIPRVGLVIHTLEGDHYASPGDYIIKGVNGEFYPCKPDIFAKTYESSTLTPPNEPLTLEQLREMNGEPVWVTSARERGNIPSRWVLFAGVSKSKRNSDVFVFATTGGIGQGYEAVNYGKTWNAYRRPPEGEV